MGQEDIYRKKLKNGQPIDLEQSITRKYRALSADMDESTRRGWDAAEMRELGHGGAAIVHRATGLDPKTIARGNRDLKEQGVASENGKNCTLRLGQWPERPEFTCANLGTATPMIVASQIDVLPSTTVTGIAVMHHPMAYLIA